MNDLPQSRSIGQPFDEIAWDLVEDHDVRLRPLVVCIERLDTCQGTQGGQREAFRSVEVQVRGHACPVKPSHEVDDEGLVAVAAIPAVRPVPTSIQCVAPRRE